MMVEAGRPDLIVQERLTNTGEGEMPYMWGHHPAFGAPFLGPECWIDAPASTYKVIDSPDDSRTHLDACPGRVALAPRRRPRR